MCEYGLMMLHSMKFVTFLVSAYAVSSTDLGALHKDECALVVHYSQDNSKMSLFSFTHRKSSLSAKQMTPLKFQMNRKPCELSVTGCLTRIFFTHFAMRWAPLILSSQSEASASNPAFVTCSHRSSSRSVVYMVK